MHPLIIRKTALIKVLLLLLLIFCANSAFGDNARNYQLIFGAVLDEGAVPQEKANSFRIASMAINYFNAYFKARNLKLRMYDRPQMASYFDTLDRLRKQKVDIAVLPSFAYLAAGKGFEFKLVGILDYPKTWKTALIVRKDSAISNIRDLMLNSGKYKILYVNELSASGYLIPKIYFTDLKINFKVESFSDGYLNSISELLSSDFYRDMVIAIDDGIFEDYKKAMPQLASQLRKVYTLENPYVYKDSIFTSTSVDDQTVQYLKEAINLAKIDDPKTRRMLELLQGKIFNALHFSYVVTNIDQSAFNHLTTYLSYYKFNFTEKFSIDRVLSKIAEDIDRRIALNSDYRPKIAVVLSGGGASGAYQAGALRALDEKLRAFNRDVRKGERPLSVGMVVGTSIGALNGIAYASGNMKLMTDFWSNVNSKDVFTPDWQYQVVIKHYNHPLIMLPLDIFAIFIFVSIFINARNFSFGKADLKNDILPTLIAGGLVFLAVIVFRSLLPFAVFLLVLIGLGSALIRQIKRVEASICQFIDKRSAPENMACKIIKAIFSFITIILTPALLAYIFILDNRMSGILLSVFTSLLVIYLLIKGIDHKITASITKSNFIRSIEHLGQITILVLGFVLFYIVLTFFTSGNAIFTIDGYERICTSEMAKMLGDASLTDKAKISREILSKKISQTLVVTASDLRHRQEVYFYFIPKLQRTPYLPVGPFWVSLNKHPEVLVDAAVATGSPTLLLPFTAMKIDNNPLALIDGGYLHFVPVDAATSLGATHLIIIMCSEDTKYDTRPEEWNFFRYYYEVGDFSTYGSQTLDYFGREKSMSFLIAPRERKIDKADFDGRYYKGTFVTPKDFMDEGYNDALGKDNGFRQLSAGDFILD